MSLSFNDRIRLNQLGTVITVSITQVQSNADVAVDLSTATNTYIDFKLPNNTITTVNATILAPATNGVIRYTDNTGIFTIRGRWQVRGRATFANGNMFPGSWSGFPVEE